MNAIQSSQDFVKALKSATDPPFQEGPCKVEIARQVWDNASFYVPSKAEVITEWILTKFLKDKGKDRESNPVLDLRYWTLLADIISVQDRVTDARPLKTWLGVILVRVPIAPIVFSFLGLYIQNNDLSKTVAACLSTMWPLAVQKTATETLLECFGALLPLIKKLDKDEGLARIASLIVNSYRNSLSNNSNKKKICNLFLQQHLLLWLERVACTAAGQQLQDSLYNAGVETFLGLDVLRQSHDSKSGNTILSALQNIAESSRNVVISALPRLFSSFLQAIKKYRTTLFGQGSNQLPGTGTNELNAAGMYFFIRCQSLLGDDQSSLDAWMTRNALLDIVRENNLLNRPLPDVELAINQIGDLAIEALGQPSVTLPAIDCLSTIARIDYDLVLPSLPRILPQLLQNDGDCSTSSATSSFLGFLDLILDFHTKTRTIHTLVSNLLDIACSPKHIASAGGDDPSQIYQSRSGCVLFRPAYLSRLAQKVQTFVTPTQTLPLAQTIAERLESAREDLEKAFRQERDSDDVHPDVLAVRLSLLTTIASVVLSSLPIRSLPTDERASLVTVVDPLRSSVVSKVISKLSKKLRGTESHEAWGWQICAAAVLRMGYVLDISRNLRLPQPSECDVKLLKKLTDLTENVNVLPEFSLEVFRYLFSKAAVRGPAETQATIEQALAYLERRLSPKKSRWSGQGRANSALALLHMLVERWIPILDSHATSEQLGRFIELLMTIPLGNVSPPESTELRPQDVLLMVLRSAQFWELRNIRSVFLTFLTSSTTIFDKLSDVQDLQHVIKAASIYQLLLYVPMEYLTKLGRAELVKRALNADAFLNSTAREADGDTGQLLIVLRIFLKRVFTYTGHVESSTFGLAGSLEHLMSREPAEFVDQDVFMDATLDLITIIFQEVCRSVRSDSKGIIEVLNCFKTWTLSETSILRIRGVARMIDLLVAESSDSSFSEETKVLLRSTHTELVLLLLPRMTALVDSQSTPDTFKARTDSMTLWTSVLSFGKWLALENEIKLFGALLASRIVNEARTMTLAMMFQELQCLPEGEQAKQLERVLAVYVSFASVLDDEGRDRLDGYMSRACRNVSASNYAHVLDLVLETLSNYKSYPPAGLTQLVHLATRLLKDYPQSASQQHTFTLQCVNTFASHETFVNGPTELRVSVLDFVAQLSSERPAALRSGDLSGIWRLLSEFLAASHLHDRETSTVIFHRIVSIMGALVRLRRDLVAWTLPHLGMMLRQLMLCMRACRPMLGAKQTAMVMDTQPQWISSKHAFGVDEARALSRLLEALGTKTVMRTYTQSDTQKAESLAVPFSNHAIYVVKAYIECMNDPLCVLSAEIVSEHGRDAVMVSALDAGGKTLMKALWREYEKQKYVGRG
ncbi:hypothetical protein F5887DRAFT_944597 [Amanita rubescens]|nr:hypothetical protein F5887DRAFT_944597 [Amanita rubescens]